MGHLGWRGLGKGPVEKCWEEPQVQNETCPWSLWDLTSSSMLISKETMFFTTLYCAEPYFFRAAIL